MPSPVFHSFAGMALAPLLPKENGRVRHAFNLAALAVAANVPDFDFLPGLLIGDARHFHRGASHSLIAIIGFTVACVLLARLMTQRSATRYGVVLGAAFAGHLFLDIFASWVDPHSGVALAWPLSDARLLFPYPLFKGISLAPGANGFLEGLAHWGNVYAVTWELVLAGVIWGIFRWVTRRP